MTALQDRPDPVPGMNRVRIIPPPEPRWAPALAYTVEIDGTPVHVHTLDVRFEPGCPPMVTISFPAVVENAEILAVLKAAVIEVGGRSPDEDVDADEPPFPGCLDEC